LVLPTLAAPCKKVAKRAQKVYTRKSPFYPGGPREKNPPGEKGG